MKTCGTRNCPGYRTREAVEEWKMPGLSPWIPVCDLCAPELHSANEQSKAASLSVRLPRGITPTVGEFRPIRYRIDYYYVQHRCRHRVTWGFNGYMVPPETASEDFWQSMADNLTGDLCPWCKHVVPEDTDSVKQEPYGGPIAFIWRGWQERQDLTGEDPG